MEGRGKVLAEIVGVTELEVTDPQFLVLVISNGTEVLTLLVDRLQESLGDLEEDVEKDTLTIVDLGQNGHVLHVDRLSNDRPIVLEIVLVLAIKQHFGLSRMTLRKAWSLCTAQEAHNSTADEFEEVLVFDECQWTTVRRPVCAVLQDWLFVHKALGGLC